MSTATGCVPTVHMAVLIPARNEEALLPRCLRSVLQAAHLLPPAVTVDVVVVADCCTDKSEEIALHLLRQTGVVLPVDAGNVGISRAEAARAALQRTLVPPAQCWLANTDADCEVPKTWLLQQLRIAQQGWDAVAGIVDVDCFAEHLPVVEGRFRTSYLTYRDGGHPHVHGANLGVRADVYLRAGGWAPLATAEDHDLWRRLRAASPLCLSDAGLQVLTSGRRVGRAPLGFAGALAKHNETAPEETAA